MKEIGGYFELELNNTEAALSFFGSNAVLLNSGRNAFEYIVQSIPNISTLWMPYFTCSSLKEPLSRLKGIRIEYYNINIQLEIQELDSICLDDNDYLLYTNYFGVKTDYIQYLQHSFNNLIVDNSQALFNPPSKFSFYSPRKFLGIPDGGIAYSPFYYDVSVQDRDSYLRCKHLLKRFDYKASEGYDDFKESNKLVGNQGVKKMSNLSFELLNNTNFANVRNIRTRNFNYLHKALKDENQIKELDLIEGAMVYPYLCDNGVELKKKLIQNKIYVATYWPNVLEEMKQESIEYQLTKIVPIPIDQRYSEEDMFLILNYLNNEI